MPDDNTRGGRYGMKWWKGLNTLEKQAEVEPLMDGGKSNKEIAEILGLETKNQVASQRNNINERRRLEGDKTVKPKESRPKRSMKKRGPSGDQIIHKIRRRREDLARVAQTQQTETEETPVAEPVESPLPPPTERDRIIEEEVRKWSTPRHGPFYESTAEDLRVGAMMHTLFGKLIDAGVAR